MKNSFYLVKTKNSPYWQIIYYKNGKRTLKSTGTKIKSEALTFLTNFKKIISEKKLTQKTLLDFESEYINHISITHSKSYVEKSVRLAFKIFKNFLNDNITLFDISIKLVEKFLFTIFSTSPQAARLYHRTLKSAFNKALLWGYVNDNVFKKIKLPKPIQTLPVYINEEEIKKICEVTKEDFLKNLFLFAFYTGARLNEILSLTWENINLEERIINISNTKLFNTKNKKDRIIPINSALLIILSAIKEKTKNKNDYIFYRIEGIKLNSNYVSKKFKKYVRKAGLTEKFHFHSLRHSFASLLHQKGVQLSIVKELLGHSDIKTTLIYSHLTKENLKQAVELIGEESQSSYIYCISTKFIKIYFILN